MRWISIDDLTSTIDDLVDTHERLARALGEHCRVTEVPALAPLLAGDAAQHAWHAELWGERRPTIAGNEPDELSAADALPHAPEPLAQIYGPALDGIVERVEGLLAATDPAIDAPTARTIDLVLADLRAQRRRAVAHGLGLP